MKKTLIAAAVAGIVAAPSVFAAAHEGGPSVSFSGSLRASYTMNDNDADPNADARIGSTAARFKVKAMDKTAGGTKIIGEIEVDFDRANKSGSATVTIDPTATVDQTDSVSTVELRTARIIAAGSWGTAVVAERSPSGQHGALVGPVDIFEDVGASVFAQADFTPNVAAYASPDLGGFKVVFAEIASGTNNGEDFDATALRAQGKAAGVSWGVGVVDYPTNEQRVGLGLGYDQGPLHVGFSYEATTDEAGVVGADGSATGLAVSYDVSDMLAVRFGTYAQTEDAAGSPYTDGQDELALGLDYKLGKSSKIYFENSSIDESAAGANDGTSKTIVGLKLTF